MNRKKPILGYVRTVMEGSGGFYLRFLCTLVQRITLQRLAEVQPIQIYQEHIIQSNPIIFYNKITSSVETERAVVVFYLDFSKVFKTVSHSFFLDKLARYRLDEWSKGWVENYQTGCTQRVIFNGFHSG